MQLVDSWNLWHGLYTSDKIPLFTETGELRDAFFSMRGAIWPSPAGMLASIVNSIFHSRLTLKLILADQYSLIL